MNKRQIIICFLLCVGNYFALAQTPSRGFIENLGQYPENVSFYTPISGGMLFIEKDQLTYSFADPSSITSRHDHFKQSPSPELIDNYALKVKFQGADINATVVGEDSSPTLYNYFIGTDTTKWVSGARVFDKLQIKNLYDGVDFELKTSPGGLKYDLKLAAGANPACIQMEYDGADAIELLENGLSIEIPYGNLTEKIPASYALCDNEFREINSRYILEGKVVSFAIDPVDQDEAVIIDPLLVFSTYSGSPSDNWGNTATYDDSGNGYTGGITTNVRGNDNLPDFPATSGAYQTVSGGGWDVAILKFDSVGQNLLYATYLGGVGSDVPQSLIVDRDGNLLILGVTSSSNFPTTVNAYDQTFNGGTSTTLIGGVDMTSGSDIFIAKLSNNGSDLLASTFIGGGGNDGVLDISSQLALNYGDESRGDINFDSKGNVLLASRTASIDFPTVNAFDGTADENTDAVIVSLKSDLSELNWSTYFGGSGIDVALSIKPDSLDNVFVAGGTTSVNLPVDTTVYQPANLGGVDGWVAHLHSSGDSLISATYLGTDNYDQVFFLDLDADENVYLSGQTTGNYPISSGVFSQGNSGQFIHKLSRDLSSSIFSTAINAVGRSTPAISLTAFLVNDCDNIYLSGWGSDQSSFSIDNNFLLGTNGLPTTPDAFQESSDGSSFYLMVLNGDASELLYATHLGDANSLVHVDGGTSRFDKHGIVYHSVCASCFGDSSFPTTPGAYSEMNGSIGCNNALFKFDLASLRARIQTNNIELSQPGFNGGCMPLTVVFENFSTGGEIYEWDFGDGNSRTVTTKDTIVHVFEESGIFGVQLRAFDPNTCIAEDYAYTTISVTAPNFSVAGDADICAGTSTQLTATGGNQFLWSPAEGLDDPTSPIPQASPQDTTIYTVTVSNPSGCDFTGSVVVNVIPQIVPDITLEETSICEGSREIKITNNSANASSITWSLGDGTQLDSWEPTHTYQTDGDYEVIGTMRNQLCERTVSLDVRILHFNIPNVLTRNNDGLNDYLKITSAKPVALTIYTRWGTKVYSANTYANDWDGAGLSAGTYYYDARLYNGEVCSGWIELLNDI